MEAGASGFLSPLARLFSRPSQQGYNSEIAGSYAGVMHHHPVLVATRGFETSVKTSHTPSLLWKWVCADLVDFTFRCLLPALHINSNK
eukprot:1525939-Rhodomonas_salina.1